MTLVRAPPQSFVESGVFVVPELAADADVATASAEWQDATASGTQAYVRFDVWDPSGTTIVASNSTTAAPAPRNGTAVAGPVQLRFAPEALQLWGTASAPLFKVTATLVLAASEVTSDIFNASVGFRRTRWDGATGFWLNDAPVKQRGFSHHNSFAGVGVAIPKRLDLFRVQVGRGERNGKPWGRAISFSALKSSLLHACRSPAL